MATTYEAVRADAATSRQVFGTDCLVVTHPDTGIGDVIAVAKDNDTAIAIATALNGV